MIVEVWGDEKLRQTIENELLKKSRDSEPSEQAEAAQARPPSPHAGPTTMLLGLKLLLTPRKHLQVPQVELNDSWKDLWTPSTRPTVEPFATVLEAEDG